MVSLEKSYSQRPEIVTREIVGETLLVPVKGNLANMQRIFSLTPVAAYIWNALDGSRKLGEIATSITREFEVEKSQVAEDCSAFVNQLLEAGLVTET